jgi:lysozyme family protein
MIKRHGVIDLVKQAAATEASSEIYLQGIAAVQLLLRGAGLYTGSLDGYIGPKTAKALQAALGKDTFSIDDIETIEGLATK